MKYITIYTCHISYKNALTTFISATQWCYMFHCHCYLNIARDGKTATWPSLAEASPTHFEISYYLIQKPMPLVLKIFGVVAL